MEIYKYHGCGNSFLLMEQKDNVCYHQLALKLCDYHAGIGADGLIVVEPKTLTMKIYNQDGSEASMCGNGLRCFIHYCFNHGLINRIDEVITIKTLAGTMKGKIISVDPFITDINLGQPVIAENNPIAIRLAEGEYKLYSLWLGTEHGVVFVDSFGELEDQNIGEKIARYTPYAKGSNINFVMVIDENKALVKTFERGVGWTESCGTGVGASAVMARILGKCQGNFWVINHYGILHCYEDEERSIHLIGPSVKIANIFLEDY